MQLSCSNTHDLIVTIVKKGWVERIIEATKKAGAEGGTVIPGRGVGIHESKKFWGIPIEPEKEILLTLVTKEQTEEVLNTIIKAGKLDQPATGIAFVVDIKRVAGIVHFLQQLEEKENCTSLENQE